MEARDLYVVNNTILDTNQFSLQVLDSNPTAGTVTNNVIANNIFGHYGYNSSVNAEVALDVWADVTGTLDVKNNNFWDTSTKVARFKDASTAPHYTVSDLNTCPNTTSDTCDANTAADPLFADYANRDFRLTSSSTIKASGTNAYEAALGSGFVDFYGNPWDAVNPSIGAIQYGLAPSLLTSGLAPTYSSIASDSIPSKLTNSNTNSADNLAVGNSGEIVYAQIDLGALYDISKIKMWHYYTYGRIYHDVIIQLSQTSDFSSYVTTVFNNDKDNSAGQGYGVDSEYVEDTGGSGKTVSFQPVLARYARFWIGGNSVNGYNHFVELQIYGSTPSDKLLSQKRNITYSANSTDSTPSLLTDGDLTAAHYVQVGNSGPQSAVIDLGTAVNISKVKLWHFYADARTYHDVIVQVSNVPDFNGGVTTIFNNDTNNSAAQGTGSDAEYVETGSGKTLSTNLSTPTAPVIARYVRFWTNGSTTNVANHYVELEVYGY